jgi:uncharacterized protein YhbP (UPF0306 family)
MNNDELKSLARKVLEDTLLMSLGTVDVEGVWVADVIFLSDENLNIYWVSMPTTRHSLALDLNNQAACTITADWEYKKERALQISGTVEKIAPSLEREREYEIKRGRPIPETEGEILSNGHVWYKLTPSVIKLTDSGNFGYKRQDVVI